jgi:hypothetical protein
MDGFGHINIRIHHAKPIELRKEFNRSQHIGRGTLPMKPYRRRIAIVLEGDSVAKESRSLLAGHRFLIHGLFLGFGVRADIAPGRPTAHDGNHEDRELP